MRVNKRTVRFGIKQRAGLILTLNLTAAMRITLVLTAIFIAVHSIRLFASPILEVKGDTIKDLVDSYLNMSAKDLSSILAIQFLNLIIVGPLVIAFSSFFLDITKSPNPTSPADSKESTKSVYSEKSTSSTGSANFGGNSRTGGPENSPLARWTSAMRATAMGAGGTDKGVWSHMEWFTKSKKRTKAILLKAAVMVLTVYWQAVFCGPALFFLYNMRGSPDSLLYANRLFILVSWFLIGYLLAYVRTGMYYPAYFLLAQDPELKIHAAIREASRMMRGHAWEYLWYKLSFIMWYLFVVVSFGIGLVYVVPYKGVCDALFIRYVDAVASGDGVE